MNTTILRAIIERLLSDEGQVNLQTKLTNLNTALTTFAQNPVNTDLQIQASNALVSLRESVDEIQTKYDPSDLKRIEEILGSRFFGEGMIKDIEAMRDQNQMTPAVIQNFVAQIVSERAAYLQQLNALLNGLKAVGVEADDLTEGEAEIGFKIPRELFSNELDGLIKELSAINRIIRAFAELATGSVEPIEVKQISTSDPTFFFGLHVKTIVLLGGAVTWALDSWKKVEEIRQIRAMTIKSTSFTPEEAAEIFDAKIKQTVEKAIEAKTNEISPAKAGKAGRSHEQSTNIAWALESILARVERGMTVQINFLPPPTESSDKTLKDAEALREIIPQLSFPKPDPYPVLALPNDIE